jgi:hypothetical protein
MLAKVDSKVNLPEQSLSRDGNNLATTLQLAAPAAEGSHG